jgi:DNA-binding transcriptional LysR family regulator
MKTPHQITDLHHTKGLSIERLMTFCRVVECGGLSKAAESFGLDLSHVSRQYTDLETFFGCQLASRSRKDFNLNEFGEDLHELASVFIQSVAKLRDRCADKRQKFSIASGGGLTSWLLSPRVDSLRSAQPGANFVIKSFRTKDIVNGVICNQIDFGLVRRSATDDSRLGSQPVGIMDYSVFMSAPTASFYNIDDNTSALEAIAKVPLILIDGDGEFRAKLKQNADMHNVTLSTPIECGSFTDAAMAVTWGNVCSVLPNLADQFFADIDHVKIPWVTDDLSREICLIWSKSALRTGGRAKRHLLDHLKRRLIFGRAPRTRKLVVV